MYDGWGVAVHHIGNFIWSNKVKLKVGLKHKYTLHLFT